MFMFTVLRLRQALPALLALLPWLASAASFQVEVDTTPLAGSSGYLAFDLTQGDPGTSNQVTITSFASLAVLGAATRSGDVAGTLAGTVTLSTSTFFNEYLQALTFPTGPTRFTLTLGSQFVAGNSPDSFALFLLDDTQTPIATGDPSGADALLRVDLVAPLMPLTFQSAQAAVAVSAVPEPAPLSLACAGLVLMLGWRRHRLRGEQAAVRRS